MKRAHVTARSLATVLAAAGALVACSAIIGTRDLTYVPDADAGADAGGTPADGGSVEAPGNGDAARDTGGHEAEASADACSVDLTTDALNCGTCGHSCQGGPCQHGACQPFALVQGEGGPWGIALDANDVYWVDYDSWMVMKAKKDGTGVTVLASDTVNEVSTPYDVVVDDSFVYWTNDNSSTTDPGRIARCAIGGCSGRGQVLATNLGLPSGLVVDTTQVFWVEDDWGKVARASKADGGVSGTIVNGLNNVHSVVADNAFVYYSSDDTIGRVAKSVSASDAGGPTQVLYTSSTLYAYGLEVDDTNVYFAVISDPGFVEMVPKTGLAAGAVPTILAADLHAPYNLAVDATNIYMIEIGPDSSQSGSPSLFVASRVLMCPKTGCPSSGPIELATAQNAAKDIAVDGTSIYWSVRGNNGNDGAIMKMAKP